MTVKRLKFVSKVIMGQSPLSENCNIEGVGFPFLQGNAEFGSIFPRPIQYCIAPPKIVCKDNILISVRAPVGEINISDQEYGIGRGLCGLEPLANMANLKYIYYYLIAIRKELHKVATGSTYEAVSREDVANLELDFPSLQFQEKIATFLDRKTAAIDTLIAKKQRLIELLEEKRAALINQAVTKGLNPDVPRKDSGIPWIGEIPEHWKVSRLGFSATSIQTGPFGSQLHSADYVNDGIPTVNPINMKHGKIFPDHQKTVDLETLKRLSRHKLKVGDLVFARRGELGRCGLVDEASEGWLCGTGSMRVRLNQDIASSSYLNLFVSLNGVASWLSLESVGSTMDNLNTGILSRLPVLIPPKSEQLEIVEKAQFTNSQIGKVIQRVIQQIKKLQEYRQSLITAAVTGKLEVGERQKG